MVYKATRLIKQEMDRRGLKYSVEEMDDRSLLNAGFSIDNGPSVIVRFISRDDDNDVSIRLFGIVNNVSESKVEEMLKAVNECNNHYRFFKFVLDNDRDVNIEYDLTQETDDSCVGAVACEIFIRIMNVAEECYPKLMKVLWD